MVNTRFEAPEGTSRVKFSDWPDEPDWPVTGTPLVSSPPPGPGSPGSSPSQLTPTLENADATSASLKPRSVAACSTPQARSEEHTSELQSLMRNSYAVFCLKKKKKTQDTQL